MTHYYVVYNPKAGGGRDIAGELRALLPDSRLTMVDMTRIEDYADFFAGMEQDDKFIVCGGDGTLNHLVNGTSAELLPEELYYYAAGAGNDLWKDLGRRAGSEPVNIRRYLDNLPRVTVNGRTYRFINCVGYGVDGYCCEEGDRMRARSGRPVNYTSIALKGLLHAFRPVNATVTVDGVERSYERVWIAPTMHGRYYGGGMLCAPEQDRMSADHSVSVVVLHDAGRMKTLAAFPSLIRGRHIKRRSMVDVLTGHEVSVRFDQPCALQIDGETISGVMGYSVSA